MKKRKAPYWDNGTKLTDFFKTVPRDEYEFVVVKKVPEVTEIKLIASKKPEN